MHLIAVVLGLSAVPALAEQVGYFDSTTCADPSGFVSCYDEVDERYTGCINDNCEGLKGDCHDACECVRQQHYTRCAVGSCWNMVYSCEYQLQASDSIAFCRNHKLDSAPFWPPPDDADGRCSCNVAKVSTAQELVTKAIRKCEEIADPDSLSADEIETYGMACFCCGVSGFLSGLSAFCPRLDPAELELEGLEDMWTAGSSIGVDWTQCDQYMDGFDCAADFDYPSNIQTYYGPGQIPDGGTETLRNVGALTSPVSATVTYTAGGQQVIIAASSTDASVPTDSSSSGDSSDNGDSDDSSERVDNAADDTEDDSEDAQKTGAGDTTEDLAVRQMVANPFLLVSVTTILGVVYML
ncbi:hypothetical protein BJX99DRAFT_260939 [Aspergillus californicus]